MQAPLTPLTPEQLGARDAVVDSIFNCLPRDITVYEALDALLSAYVAAGTRTRQLPAIKAGLKTALLALNELHLQPGQNTLVDVRQETVDAANGLVRALRSTIPAGMPHPIAMSALLGLFRELAMTHTSSINVSARNARVVANELEALADEKRSHPATH